MADTGRRSLRTRAAVAAGAGCVIVLSVFLPWVTAGLGGNSPQYDGLRILPLAIPELLAAISTIVVASAAGLLDRPRFTPLATLTAALAFAFTAPVIVALEAAAVAVPNFALPATLQRNSLDLSAGMGLWIAATAAAVAVVALADWGISSIEPRIWTRRGNRAWALALLVLLSLTIFFGWLRYQTWFGASTAGEHLNLAGWASPWIGPLSLLAVWLLIAAVALAALARTESAGLLAASAGWLVTFLAAVGIIGARSIGDLSDFASGSNGPDFHVTVVVWASFLVGLSAAAVGGWLVSLKPRARTGG